MAESPASLTYFSEGDLEALFTTISNDEHSEDESEPFSSISSLPSRLTIPLSLRATYTDWNPLQAFRELVQNWRDGIIASFDLAEEDFHVERECNVVVGGAIEIVYKVPRPSHSPMDWLGYIRFRSRGQGGTVEITNFNATLHPWHLDMGGTSKKGTTNQAGAHGEGLKVALLALMRASANHKVRCRSGGFNWTFNFAKNGRLVARLNRISDSAATKEKARTHAKSGGLSLSLSPAAKGDVQFIIGEPHNGRSDYGTPTKRQLVTKEAFEAWTRAALFLENPTPDEMVKTSSGDLLLGQRFRQRLYLKGLFLSEDSAGRLASVTNMPLRYGYNFSTGTKNRERQSLAGAYEESATILDIWAKAVAKRPDLVGALSDMLNTTHVEYADVAGAAQKIGKTTTRALMAYLQRDNDSEGGCDRWLLSPNERRD
ncbi:hypothetical protein K4F52_010362, partial [Lecanicillium sp. MT-2017a]